MSEPVLILFHPPEPCAACARRCVTCCPVCRGPFCLACIYDHHRTCVQTGEVIQEPVSGVVSHTTEGVALPLQQNRESESRTTAPGTATEVSRSQTLNQIGGRV